MGWRDHSGGVAAPTLALSLAVLGGTALTWWATLTQGLPLWAGALIQSPLAYLAFTPLHEGVHGNISGGKRWAWLDPLLGSACALLLFAPFPAFKTMHLRHHANTNDPEKDPDFWVAGDGALSIAARCLSVVPHYYRLILTDGSSASLRRARDLAVLTIAALLSVLIGLIALGYGAEVLALWVLPAWLATGLLAFFFDWVPHVPHASRQRGLDTRVVLGPGLTALMVWQNFHLIHHLYPRVPFFRTGRLFDELRPELEAKGSPILVLGGGRREGRLDEG